MLLIIILGSLIALVGSFASAASHGNVTSDPELQAQLDAYHNSK